MEISGQKRGCMLLYFTDFCFFFVPYFSHISPDNYLDIAEFFTKNYHFNTEISWNENFIINVLPQLKTENCPQKLC